MKGIYLDEITEKIQHWAERSQLADHPYILSLNEALTSKSALRLQALYPFRENFPLASSEAGRKFTKLGRWIAIFRNALIFAPVALTWKAVSEATEAFAIYTDANKDLPVNFLAFWQNGYGYLDEFWKIGHIAEIDFLLILAVIFLTLASVFAIQWGQELKGKELASLTRMRDDLILQLTSMTVTKTVVSKSQIDEVVVNSLREINESARHIYQSLKTLEESAKKIEKSSVLFSENSHSFKDAVTTLSKSSREIADYVADLGTIAELESEKRSMDKVLTVLRAQLEKYFSK